MSNIIKVTRQTLFLLLIISVLLVQVSCDIKASVNDSAGTVQNNSIDSIPGKTTVSPPQKSDQRFVVRFYFSYDELYKDYNLILENGNNIIGSVAGFEFENEEFFSGYWLVGRLLPSSVLLRDEKEFYELEYDYMYMFGAFLSKDVYKRSEENILESTFVLHDSLYAVNTLAIIEVTPEPFAPPLPESIDSDKLELVREDEAYDSALGGYYSYQVHYDGERMLAINSHVPIEKDLFDMMKDKLVIIKNINEII